MWLNMRVSALHNNRQLLAEAISVGFRRRPTLLIKSFIYRQTFSTYILISCLLNVVVLIDMLYLTAIARQTNLRSSNVHHTHWAHDVESRSKTLIQRRNNIARPVDMAILIRRSYVHRTMQASWRVRKILRHV